MFLENLKRYIQFCEYNVIFLLLGILNGCLASYFGVMVNENLSKIMTGDFSDERLFFLFQSSFLNIMTTSLRGSLFTYSAKTMNHRMRCVVFNKLLYQHAKYYEEKSINDIIEIATNDIEIVSNIIALNVNVLSRSLINVIAIYYLLFNISSKLTIITTIMFIVNYTISHIYDLIHKKTMSGFDEANKKLSGYTRENLSHISMIKSFSTEEETIDRFCKYSAIISEYYIKECVIYAIDLFIICNMPTISTIVIILSSKYLSKTNGLISFILHNQGMYGTIKQIIDLKDEFVKCKKPFERIVNIIDSKPIEKGYYIPNEELKGSITFDNIKFKYTKSEEIVLNNFNFTINDGDRIAIIGESGCGKSTIAKLLIGILSPCEGTMYIDGVNIQQYDDTWLKRNIGYISQDSVLFSDTIANNISYGTQSTRDEIENAAKMANAHEFITKLKDQYDTVLDCTELGSLSGGQKQRISIARALIRKPKILIFDEATSALDTYCEETVQKTINEVFGKYKSTMIIIAHRKSALSIANKIYTLKNSKVIQQINTS